MCESLCVYPTLCVCQLSVLVYNMHSLMSLFVVLYVHKPCGMDCLCMCEADNSIVVIDNSIIVRHIVVIDILVLFL